MANVLKKEEGISNCNPGDKNSRPGARGVTSVGGRLSLLWRPWGGWWGFAHEKQFRSFQDKCVQILLKSIVRFGIENFQHYVKSAPKVLSILRLYHKFSICTSISVRIMLLSVKIRNVLCEKENGTFKRKVVISRSKSLARPQLVGNLPKVAI